MSLNFLSCHTGRQPLVQRGKGEEAALGPLVLVGEKKITTACPLSLLFLFISSFPFLIFFPLSRLTRSFNIPDFQM